MRKTAEKFYSDLVKDLFLDKESFDIAVNKCTKAGKKMQSQCNPEHLKEVHLRRLKAAGSAMELEFWHTTKYMKAENIDEEIKIATNMINDKKTKQKVTTTPHKVTTSQAPQKVTPQNVTTPPQQPSTKVNANGSTNTDNESANSADTESEQQDSPKEDNNNSPKPQEKKADPEITQITEENTKDKEDDTDKNATQTQSYSNTKFR